MSRFSNLRQIFAALAMAALPVSATACCGEAPVEERSVAIDPERPDYEPLVQACLANDLACEDLCRAILLRSEVVDAELAHFSECRIMNEAATEVRMSYSIPRACVAGRRPPGLGAPRIGRVASPTARWLAEMARLEGAAVYAFAHTASALARLGAPAELVERAIVAAHQEVVHAALMAELARAHGAEPLPIEIDGFSEPSLLELCLENATEGCVRETFGALIATYQARAARDPGVRAALTRIAADETEHAELSAAIDRWARLRLSARDQGRVDQAARTAIDELVAAARAPVDQELTETVGLPDAGTAVRLAQELERQVWS